MVTVNRRRFIIVLQWISPSNCNVDFIQAAVYLQPKLTFLTVAAVLCPVRALEDFLICHFTKYCLNPAMEQSGENTAPFNVLLPSWVKMKSKN